MDHHHTAATTGRAEAERLLGIAENFLQTRDLNGAREFALLAQETEHLLEGSDQILAISDVLLSSDRRVVNNRHHDWYAILQTDRHLLTSDPDLLKKNYRRLALLLHPDKNRFPLADSAFKLVSDAWATLSDSSRRSLYDHELNVYERVELRPQSQSQTQGQNSGEKDKLPVRKSPRGASGGGGDGGGTAPARGPGRPKKVPTPNSKNVRMEDTRFWTTCPYCYVLYEYPRVYEDCCLRCQNCERAYHATVLSSLPPLVPGKEAYYCCWGFFPLGFSVESGNGKGVGSDQNHGINNSNVNGGSGGNHGGNGNANSVFPNWMPTGMFNNSPVANSVPIGGANLNVGGGIDISDGGFGNNSNVFSGSGGVRMGTQGTKKRGRPRKNP